MWIIHQMNIVNLDQSREAARFRNAGSIEESRGQWRTLIRECQEETALTMEKRRSLLQPPASGQGKRSKRMADRTQEPRSGEDWRDARRAEGTAPGENRHRMMWIWTAATTPAAVMTASAGHDIIARPLQIAAREAPRDQEALRGTMKKESQWKPIFGEE